MAGAAPVATAEGRVVVFGGSFDPPHISHQLSCLYLLEGLGAAEVWVVPSFSHPFGKDLTSFTHRYQMCARMAAPLGPRVQVLDVERRLGGAGRTIDTLEHLAAAHPARPLALAVGADLLADTPRWHRWEDIVARVPVVVIGRAGYPQPHCAVELPAVASHTLRAWARAGRSLAGLVPASVAAYIREAGLYRADS